MGGAGIREYLRADGVGPSTIFFSCCIDGGLDWLPFRLDRAIGAMPDFGFVAKRLFSCSSLASNKAVDYKVSYN
jgi:hypothetical protein